MPNVFRDIQPRTAAADEGEETVNDIAPSRYRIAILLSLAAAERPVTLLELQTAVGEREPDISPDPIEQYVKSLMTENLIIRAADGTGPLLTVSETGKGMAEGYAMMG